MRMTMIELLAEEVKVYWSESRKWFAGHIKAFDDMKRLHSILYDDGDKEELDLRKERFELEIMPTEGFSLRVDISKKKIGALDSDVASSTMSPGKKLRVGDAEEATKSLGLKNVGKIGSSKSRRKGTKLKKDSDVVPDNVVEVITDKINVAEELAELNVDKDFDDFKPLAEIAAQLRPGFEVKKMGSDTHDTEGSEKTESDDSILLKSFGSLKKETKGAINVKSSKLITRKEINEAETLELGYGG
ncbi:Sister chromatid cohesion PDS5-like protein [Melia azedarach]|uniref:Sister chromatid cohesion PDS5-like protein n=1 Tax=Melia azedarach TaxID=155640 RepID=A0ACC1YLG5_MELAZ|nr:Sister chromatid cohesion PDS5-like protein [Melia azedarach]